MWSVSSKFSVRIFSVTSLCKVYESVFQKSSFLSWKDSIKFSKNVFKDPNKMKESSRNYSSVYIIRICVLCQSHHLDPFLENIIIYKQRFYKQQLFTNNEHTLNLQTYIKHRIIIWHFTNIDQHLPTNLKQIEIIWRLYSKLEKTSIFQSYHPAFFVTFHNVT